MNVGIRVNNISHPETSCVLVSSRDNNVVCTGCGAGVNINLEPATVANVTKDNIMYELRDSIRCSCGATLSMYIVETTLAVHLAL